VRDAQHELGLNRRNGAVSHRQSTTTTTRGDDHAQHELGLNGPARRGATGPLRRHVQTAPNRGDGLHEPLPVPSAP
jgi:hypothetical protein